MPKQKRVKAYDETDSDSDFDGNTGTLEEYVNLGELGGKVPPSLLVNINFEKFAKENGIDLLNFDGTKPEKHH